MSRPRFGRALSAAAAGFLLALGCGDPTAPPAPVATVAITPAENVEVVPTGMVTLSVTLRDAAGQTLTGRQVEWSSSDPAIATVAAGVVTGVAPGTATITATSESRSANVSVTVKEGVVVTPTGASFTNQAGNVSVAIPAGAVSQSANLSVAAAASPLANPRLVPGTAFQLGPPDLTLAQPATLTIKYDPAGVAADSPESGLQLYELATGRWAVIPGSSVNIAGKTVSGSVTRAGTYAVLMQPRVETVSLARDTATLQVNTTLQLTATLRDNEGLVLNRTITWTSSSAAARVDANGLVTALLPGQATITATVEGKSAAARITVVPGPPTSLARHAGEGQTAAAGSAVANPPSVIVTDAFGNPVPGVAVTFAVASGGGSITGASTTTNASGIATVGSWTLGTTVGPNTLTATAAGIASPVTISANAVAGAAARVEVVQGNNQTATAGGLVPVAPGVRITDANGNPVAGITITFTPGSGSGSVTGGSVQTNSSGVATVGSWRLGPTPGTQTLSASASGISGGAVTISATAVAPVPATVTANAGNGQTARAGEAVAVPPSVAVTDAAGVPVPGYTVTFEVTGGGGSVTGAQAVTDVNGIATVGSWTLGLTGGTHTLVARAGTLSGSPVTFTATALVAPPTNLVIWDGDGQTANAGATVPKRPMVRVTDAEGRGVPGVSVTFSIRSGGGSITGPVDLTDADGVAAVGSWTLGLGGNSLFASVEGLAGSPVIFVAWGNAQVQIVTFGDSNTDLGYLGDQSQPSAASYVSSSSLRASADAANSALTVAGKIERAWANVRPGVTLRAVNHGISGTHTGTGRSLLGSPNSREAVQGVTRFEGEVLGLAYPWNGAEPSFGNLSGSIRRVQAFRPRASDFAYVSMGTNDAVDYTMSVAQIAANLEWMVDQWIAAGLPANHFIITTIPPRAPGAESARIPALNNEIRGLASRKGLRMLDLAAFTSADNGLTWRSSSLHVGDSLHYSESVRTWIADNVVSIMHQLTP